MPHLSFFAPSAIQGSESAGWTGNAGSEIQPYLSSVWMRSVVNTTNPSAQLPCNFGLLAGLGP